MPIFIANSNISYNTMALFIIIRSIIISESIRFISKIVGISNIILNSIPCFTYLHVSACISIPDVCASSSGNPKHISNNGEVY